MLSFTVKKKESGFSCRKPMFIAPYSVCSIRKVKIHDFYSHNKASQGPANKLLYGCTIDFTFTRPDLKGLWDCPWIPNLCATLSLSSWHPLPSVNWQDYSLNRISLPFILRTTGQSGRWQPSDSIQMEMKASGGMVLFVKHWRKLLGSGSSSAVPNWVLRLWLHLLWDFSTRNLILNTVIIRVVCRLNLWSDYHKIYRICCRAIKMTFFFTTSLLQDSTTCLHFHWTYTDVKHFTGSIDKAEYHTASGFWPKGACWCIHKNFIFPLGRPPFALLWTTYSEPKKNTSKGRSHSLLRRCHSC